MRSRAEIEIESALNILTSMSITLGELEKFWPPSKRGSNAQRQLEQIKAKRDAAEKCLRDAQAEFT